MPSKLELREFLRNDRQSFVKNKLNSFSQSFSNRSEWTTLLEGKTCVAGYSPVGSEADPTELLEMAHASGITTALPYLSDREAKMEFRAWSPHNPLERAPFGFKQPVSAAPCVSPDLILMPLVGFDRAMNRLGQGAGHYDCALACLPDARRIGIAWSVQEVSSVPTDSWDMPMDGVFTENEWITGPNSRILLQ